jgi:hypothetical protein
MRCCFYISTTTLTSSSHADQSIDEFEWDHALLVGLQSDAAAQMTQTGPQLRGMIAAMQTDTPKVIEC